MSEHIAGMLDLIERQREKMERDAAFSRVFAAKQKEETRRAIEETRKLMPAGAAPNRPARKSPVPTKCAARVVYDEGKHKEVVEMRRQTLSWDRIAERLNVSRKWLKTRYDLMENPSK